MFGDLLRKFIDEKYKNLTKFSDACDISKGHLSDILSGRIMPKKSLLNVFFEKLNLNEADKNEMLKQWALDKSDGILRPEIEKLELENKNMLEVLKNVKNEKVLLKEIEELKEYENFYNLFFKELNSEETKTILNAIVRELKAMSFDSPKKDLLKEKFEKLEKIINEI